jgi:hypothetical protein
MKWKVTSTKLERGAEIAVMQGNAMSQYSIQ